VVSSRNSTFAKDGKSDVTGALVLTDPSPAQCYATFLYLIKNPKQFVIGSSSAENIPSSSELDPVSFGLAVTEIEGETALNDESESFDSVGSVPRNIDSLRTARVFHLRSPFEVAKIRWLESECLGYKPGTAFSNFLRKVRQRLSYVETIPVVDVSTVLKGVESATKPHKSSNKHEFDPAHPFYDQLDRIFIRAIQAAAFAPIGIPNPYRDIFSSGILPKVQQIYAELSKSDTSNTKSSNSTKQTENSTKDTEKDTDVDSDSTSISVLRNAWSKPLESLRLLKDLGIYTPWENTSVYPYLYGSMGSPPKALAGPGFTGIGNGDASLDFMEGHLGSYWANLVVEESKGWAEVLLNSEVGEIVANLKETDNADSGSVPSASTLTNSSDSSGKKRAAGLEEGSETFIKVPGAIQPTYTSHAIHRKPPHEHAKLLQASKKEQEARLKAMAKDRGVDIADIQVPKQKIEKPIYLHRVLQSRTVFPQIPVTDNFYKAPSALLQNGTSVSSLSPASGTATESNSSSIPNELPKPLHISPFEQPWTDPLSHLRQDFTQNHPIYVIDSPTAHELDDGISISRVAPSSSSSPSTTTTDEVDRNDDLSDYWIHIHIADPTAYIPPSHPLSMWAQLRCSSVYLPERHYPMLPDALAEHLFNLGEPILGAKKKSADGGGSLGFAMTFSCRLGSDGDIIDYKITPSVIKDAKILHYRQVNKVLDWQNIYGAEMSSKERETIGPWVKRSWEEVYEKDVKGKEAESKLDSRAVNDLRLLQKVAQKHLRFRTSAKSSLEGEMGSGFGGFHSDQPSNNVKLTPYPQPFTIRTHNYAKTGSLVSAYDPSLYHPVIPDIHLDPNGSSHLEPANLVVGECMVMAGRIAARFCQDYKVPGIYRGQESPFGALVSSSPENANLTKQQTLERAFGNVDQQSGVLPFSWFRQVLPYFPSAQVSTSPMGHFSMGIPGPSPTSLSSSLKPSNSSSSSSKNTGYIKVTSPLRRFKDMLMHYQIKSALLQNSLSKSAQVSQLTLGMYSLYNYPWRLEDLERMLGRLVHQEKLAGKLMGKGARYWALEWVRRRETVKGMLESEKVLNDVGGDGRVALERLLEYGNQVMPPTGFSPRSMSTVWGLKYKTGGGLMKGRASSWGMSPLSQLQPGEKLKYKIVLTGVVPLDSNSSGSTHNALSVSSNSSKVFHGLLAEYGGIGCHVDMSHFRHQKLRRQMETRLYESITGDQPEVIVVDCVVETVDPMSGMLVMRPV
jgi:hypothetical protein